MKGDLLFKWSTDMLQETGGDKAFAVKMMERAAGYGQPFAIYAIGTWYLHGKYYKKNILKGVDLIKEAAKANVADAQFDLAVCYERGFGVEKNLIIAFPLYLESA